MSNHYAITKLIRRINMTNYVYTVTDKKNNHLYSVHNSEEGAGREVVRIQSALQHVRYPQALTELVVEKRILRG